jgi:hypothetical protein
MLTTAVITLALTVAPTIRFTSDSVYTNDKIIEYSLSQTTTTEYEEVEQTVGDSTEIVKNITSETVNYALELKQNYVLGYDIYDDADTDYIDGIQMDGEWLTTSWAFADFDPNVEHTITVKTVYSDDISGMFAAAKNGDFSALLSNPVTIMQLFYYVLAAVSLGISGIAALKSKKKRVKTGEDIAAKVSDAANNSLDSLKSYAITTVNDMLTPVVTNIQSQYKNLLEAMVLSRSGDENSTLALLELLKNNLSDDGKILTESVKAQIQKTYNDACSAKNDAIKALKDAASEASDKATEVAKGILSEDAGSQDDGTVI